MADCMSFPETPLEFLKLCEFKDEKEIYTNGSMLIPTFRVEQMIEHYFNSAPTADVQEVRHGKNVTPFHPADEFICSECSKPYSANSNYAEKCKDFEQKKITNFERIKNMSVEEMAYFLNGFFSTCELCAHNTKNGGVGCTGGCIDGKTHWLESEAEE